MVKSREYSVIITEKNEQGEGFVTRKMTYTDTSPLQAARHIARENGYVAREVCNGQVFDWVIEIHPSFVADLPRFFANNRDVRMLLCIQAQNCKPKTFMVRG